MVRWNIVGTQTQIPEGSKENTCQARNENLPELVTRILPPSHPLSIIGPSVGELPR